MGKELDEGGKINFPKSFGRWYGDWLIGSGIFMTAQNVKTFTYEFDVIPIWFHSEEHRGNCQIKPKWCEGDHADDLPYVFGWVLGDKPGQRIKPTEMDRKLPKKSFMIGTPSQAAKSPFATHSQNLLTTSQSTQICRKCEKSTMKNM